MRISDWSSDVCSSDLVAVLPAERLPAGAGVLRDGGGPPARPGGRQAVATGFSRAGDPGRGGNHLPADHSPGEPGHADHRHRLHAACLREPAPPRPLTVVAPTLS